jgi:hypothetical protein
MPMLVFPALTALSAYSICTSFPLGLNVVSEKSAPDMVGELQLLPAKIQAQREGSAAAERTAGQPPHSNGPTHRTRSDSDRLALYCVPLCSPVPSCPALPWLLPLLLFVGVFCPVPPSGFKAQGKAIAQAQGRDTEHTHSVQEGDRRVHWTLADPSAVLLSAPLLCSLCAPSLWTAAPLCALLKQQPPLAAATTHCLALRAASPHA